MKVKDTGNNRDILEQALEQIWNQGRQESIADYYHDDFVAHINGSAEPITGIQGITEVLTELKRAFPDFHETCHDLVVEADKVVARLTISGTQQGPYQGQASNGRRFEIDSIDIYRFSKGKIVEQWGVLDMTTMATQLGWN